MNQPEARVCQNCKSDFVIEPDDFTFYEKIGVPPPTFCPRCRLQRRLAFFNLTNLYKRKCDLCQEEKISMYAPDIPYKIYCTNCWWSDDWDSTDYGRDYDFSRPFFEQFSELWHETPLAGLSLDSVTIKTSPHNNHAGHLKNCYLLFHADYIEDSAYGFFSTHSKSIFDCSVIMLSELCYDVMNTFKSNHCIGGRNQISDSLDCIFTRDCVGCQSCFGSANIRGEKYNFFNQKLTKEEYQEKVKKYDLGSYKKYQETKKQAQEHWKKYPPKPYYEEFNTNTTGNYVFQSKNCKECFEVMGAQDCKFLLLVAEPPTKDCYDVMSWGNNLELAYECCNVGENTSNIKFGQESGINLLNAEYVKLSTGGSDHFGCVSMKKGNFVIFNKKYPEKEYYELKSKIISHMNEMPYIDKAGRIYKYGEFFPIELSPWAYNETVADKFFPLSKDKAEVKGYSWREEEKREYKTSIKTDDLPDHIKDTNEKILDEIIACKNCGRGYRIIKMELEFLKKMNLPLPRECPLCRINQKLDAWVKNMRVIDRSCDKCGAAFKTSFDINDAPTIYCKNCYLKTYIN